MRSAGLLILVMLVAGCAAPTPAFSREQAIARARQAVMESMPEYAPMHVRIDSVSAELVSLADAEQRMNSLAETGDANVRVWFVTVLGKIVFEGPSPPEVGHLIYEADTMHFVFDAATGDQRMASREPTGVVGVTPLPPTPMPTP